ncbi:MAG: helix-turn-helix transcriptional regulator [Lachnospiraceae bacterium]|nr:helix-turn-helix transcriptional regulator [Lachnospiraceae bacterium]
MNMADRIQSLRKSKGFSQEELADKVGVSRQAVSKWESEQSTPDIEKIIIMSELFEVTTDYILKGTEPVNMTSRKTVYSLYSGFAVLFATIAGIWSFTANRFRIDECFFIMAAGAVIGCAIALIIQVISNQNHGRQINK